MPILPTTIPLVLIKDPVLSQLPFPVHACLAFYHMPMFELVPSVYMGRVTRVKKLLTSNASSIFHTESTTTCNSPFPTQSLNFSNPDNVTKPCTQT